MKILVCLSFLFFCLTSHSQTRSLSVLDPGNWTFVSDNNTEWSRIALNGKDLMRDTSACIIMCDTNKKVIYFLTAPVTTKDTIAVVRYNIVETWWDDPQQMRKGVFYYRTAGMGTIEFWPGEMVVRDWPGEFRKTYLKMLKQRPKPKSVQIVKKTITVKKIK